MAWCLRNLVKILNFWYYFCESTSLQSSPRPPPDFPHRWHWCWHLMSWQAAHRWCCEGALLSPRRRWRRQHCGKMSTTVCPSHSSNNMKVWERLRTMSLLKSKTRQQWQKPGLFRNCETFHFLHRCKSLQNQKTVESNLVSSGMKYANAECDKVVRRSLPALAPPEYFDLEVGDTKIGTVFSFESGNAVSFGTAWVNQQMLGTALVAEFRTQIIDSKKPQNQKGGRCPRPRKNEQIRNSVKIRSIGLADCQTLWQRLL